MTSSPRLTDSRCATPRNGSSPLCRAPATTGVAGTPEEYFQRVRHSGLPRDERFVSSYAPSVRPELDHPGLSADHIPDPPLSRQGDDRSARWVARFKEAA